jgi:hypothetical protein
MISPPLCFFFSSFGTSGLKSENNGFFKLKIRKIYLLLINIQKKLSLPQGGLWLAETYSSDRTFSSNGSSARLK